MPLSASPASDNLEQPQPEYIVPQPPQPLGMKLQPDQEQQQHDAELGDVQHLLRRVDQAEAVGADQRAGDEIAEHRAEAEPAEQP